MQPTIIQFSPPRTGSTMLWHVLKVILPDYIVLKTHNLSRVDKSEPLKYHFISSIRHPVDMVSSFLQCHGYKIHTTSVKHAIDEIYRQGITDLPYVQHNPRGMILKYENFYNDWDYLFSNIEDFLGVTIDQTLRDKAYQEYNIDKVEQKSKQFASFKEYGPELIHGNHISPFKGVPGHGKELLNEEMIKLIHDKFYGVFDMFKYG